MSVNTEPAIKVMELIMQDAETLFGLQKNLCFTSIILMRQEFSSFFLRNVFSCSIYSFSFVILFCEFEQRF